MTRIISVFRHALGTSSLSFIYLRCELRKRLLFWWIRPDLRFLSGIHPAIHRATRFRSDRRRSDDILYIERYPFLFTDRGSAYSRTINAINFIQEWLDAEHLQYYTKMLIERVFQNTAVGTLFQFEYRSTFESTASWSPAIPTRSKPSSQRRTTCSTST